MGRERERKRDRDRGREGEGEGRGEEEEDGKRRTVERRMRELESEKNEKGLTDYERLDVRVRDW